MINNLRRSAYKFFRTIQVNFPALQDLKFQVIRSIRLSLRLPAEADFKALRYIQGIDRMMFVDIGANRGDTILSIRLYAENAHIKAFEPNPLVFEKTKNLLKNDDNVELINSGLGDQSGTFNLFIPFYKKFMFDGLASFVEAEAYNWLKTRIFFFDEKYLKLKNITCSIRTLDSYSFAPDFIKMDVQGYELNVLIGARITLEKFKPILLIETPTKEVDEYLKKIDYSPFSYDPKEGLKTGLGRLNTFYFHASKIHLIEK